MLLPACVLATALCMPVAAPAAWADSVSEAQETLDSAEARLAQIVDEHDKLQDEADELQVKIDDAVEGVIDAQSEVQEGRARLGEMMAYEYKSGGVGMLNVFLEAENLSDLLSNLHYVDSVQKAQAEEIELQRQREETFHAALDDLNAKKDEQMDKLAEADRKAEEAAQVVAGAEAQLSKAKDEAAAAAEAERLAALKAQADALAAEQQKQAAAEPPAEQAAPTTPPQEGSGSLNGNGAGNAGTAGSGSDSDTSNGGSTGEQTGWKTGSASAYGSTSDGTLGKPTASGALVTETSMGVAIPLSWPNARSYLGRQVEINHGGTTVIATVNDLGGMGGGSRSLDLQPGVWKAFGASSCLDWGVRTVSYRFL
ncbi:MAG: peptidase [Slackia sp.]|nr:peptidase [Slackia sp.]